MTATAHQLDIDQPRFAISIGGKIYGPYAAQQMRTYIAEGRVTASSLISREGGAWTPASDDPFCAQILAQRARRGEAGSAASVDVSKPDDGGRVISSASAREAFLKELEGVRGIRANESVVRSAESTRPEQRAAAPLFPTERDTQTEPSNFIIIFDLKSRGHGKLEEQIMSLGRAVRVMQGIWLLNAPMSSGAIRNQLMKYFGTGDTFLIVDATRDKLAWFNLGPETDSQIRQVWRRG